MGSKETSLNKIGMNEIGVNKTVELSVVQIGRLSPTVLTTFGGRDANTFGAYNWALEKVIR